MWYIEGGAQRAPNNHKPLNKMKTIKYKNFSYSLVWDTAMNVTTYVAYGTVNGEFLLVHSATSEQACIDKMNLEIESKIIAHQI